MDIAGYLREITEIYKSGDATEHSYRAPLQRLFESIDDSARVINEPKRSEGGMPDFLFQRNGVAFGWAEAKDIDKDVIKLKGYSVEQRKRYENAYPNLLYTNGVDFEFIRNKEVVHHTSIADFLGDLGGLQPLPEKFGELERQLKLFVEQKPISIRSAQKLAEMMAGKAAIIKDEVGIALAEDAEFRSGLGRQYNTFKDNLLPNLTPGEFADIYAETITYGMFAARLHDDTLETFSRQEALEKLPKSNPFLRGLFQYVAGYDIPDRLKYVVDDLAEVLRASDPHSLFEDFGKFTARNDPFIHFYETFLAAYNPKKRKSRGVWYTPEPVVDFIVRAVDDVLKTEFGIADGLADTGKVTVDWDTGQTDKKGKPVTIRKDVHRVQILDPATGTGTFLAKTVQTIADRVKARAPGKWSSYVEEDLLPRLHGFELLMASYAMCHMKLDMQLTESGYVPSKNPPRLSVWLTNALEPAEREVKDLFFQQLADEARGASEVKRQTPIMCVIGNPPYSASSQNMSDHARDLVRPYKEGLSERKINLDDDYIKFLRLAETYIEKSGQGVVGFITNNSYLDGTTLRMMRKHFLDTFDRINVLNLFGDTRSAEEDRDENVFDIMQGVAIVIMTKGGSGPSGVHYSETKGSRRSKSEFLGCVKTDFFQRLTPSEPYNFFVPKDFKGSSVETFGVNDLFGSLSSGIQTKNDAVTIQIEESDRDQIIDDFLQLDNEQLEAQYSSKKVWTVGNARSDLATGEFRNSEILYRPFDIRHTVQTQKSNGFLGRPRFEVMRHFAFKNLGLIVNKKFVGENFSHAGVSSQPICHGTFYLGNRGQDFLSPLYLYPDENADQADALAPTERTLNLDPKLYAKICKAAGIDPKNTVGPDDDFRAPTGDARPSEVKVFDYIYGVLHSPDYRKTFAEFLKIDFPRIPYPASPEVFKHVSEKGEALRRLHLMEPAAIGEANYPFMGDAEDGEEDSVVAPAHPKLKDGRVYINKSQYFDGVPQIAWDFYIGGYQPAQKWLKDRKGRALSYADIGHYQSIVKILVETDRIMREIELPLETEDA
ncbi:type ISP restriction/modification enzyme [Qipengyuania flava]|uniref:type ISP restriction/modification enzyme n=1 Tax=Qipengyuania flava TaxID=192812 RepID=UPI00273D669A|nr:type ISP restriction/modification enzyme [Qipengyuania flava]